MNLTNTQFVFESKTKTVLFAGMGLGLFCLVLSFFGDDQFHTRFWTNYLHNSVYFTGIAFMALAFMCAQIVAFGGWNAVVRRVWEAMSMFTLVGIVLMSVLVIGVWGHLHHLYHWNTPGVSTVGDPNYDRILAGKAGFLNPVWYTVCTVGFLALWYFMGNKIRSLSVAQDTKETASFDYYKKIRKWSAAFLPIIGFLVCAFIWQSIMSIDSHWYSTMFAWYSMISLMLGAISMSVMLIIYLKSKGYMEYVSRDHIHDVGKFLFGISVFWAYLWFDQFMLIWYANNGEETIYFKERMNHYPVLFWGNLLLNFITPFFILMRNDTKRKYGTMFFVAAIVFFGHWWDFFYMIKPGARINADHAAHGPSHTTTSHDNVAPIPGSHSTTAAEGHSTPETHAAEGHTPTTAHTTPEAHTEGHAATAAHATEGVKAESHDAAAAHATEGAQGESHAKPASAATEGHSTTEPTKTHTEEGSSAAASHADPDAATGNGDAHGEGGGDPSKAFKLGYTIPGLEEIGIMLGFLSFFLFMFFSQLAKASLVPWRDPFLQESLHHETGALVESEQDEHAEHAHH